MYCADAVSEANLWSEAACSFFLKFATEQIIQATVNSLCDRDHKPMVELTVMHEGQVAGFISNTCLSLVLTSFIAER